MSSTDKNMTRKIFSSKENLDLAMEFIDIWREDSPVLNSRKEFIDAIRNDSKKLDAANSFEELWNRRSSVFLSCVVDDLEKKGFKRRVGNSEVTVYKELDSDISLGFWIGSVGRKPQEYYCAYGFTITNSEIKKIGKKQDLERLLKNNISVKLPGEYEVNDVWIDKAITFDALEINKVLISDFVSDLVTQFDLLEEKYKSESNCSAPQTQIESSKETQPHCIAILQPMITD